MTSSYKRHLVWRSAFLLGFLFTITVILDRTQHDVGQLYEYAYRPVKQKKYK